jgi:PAS domain S-box-containing protein/putative nucleotidyltransferase with HDIG domain
MKNSLSYSAERKIAKEALDESEAREQQHGRDMAFLSRSAMAFFELPSDGDIYQLIIELLKERFKNDAILAIGDYDEKAAVFRPRAIHGIENMRGAIKKVLGKDPMELSGDFGPAAKKALSTGKLTKVDCGLRDFSSNLLPAPVAHAAEKLLGLTDFYVMGFTKVGKILGGLSIILRKHTALPDPLVMEAFAGQAAVALERWKAQEELKSSEERLKLLFEYAPDAYYLNDLKGHFIDGNKEAERTLGYKKEELIGKSFLSLKILSPGQLPKAAALLAKNAMGKSTGPDEFVLHRKDGSQVISEIRTYPIKMNAQTLVLGIARDITERKQAEEEQRQQDKKFRAFVETTNEWIWSIDRKGKHTFCNPALESILGYSPEEFVGKDSLAYICDEDRPKVQEMLKEKNSKKEGWSGLVLRWRHKDGSFRFLESTAVPILNQDGELVGYQGADRDITKRKRTEEALRESEEKFRNLAEQSPNMIFINKRGRVVYANEKSEKILGYKREEFYSPEFDFFQLHASESRDAIKVSFSRHLKAEEVLPIEITLLAKDGKRIEAILATKLIDYGEEKAILGIVTDITERKKAGQALLQSEQKYRELANSLPTCIFEADLNGRLTFANRTAFDWFGYSEADLLEGKTVLQMLGEADRQRADEGFRRALSAGEASSREFTAMRKDGRTFPALVTVRAMVKDGRPIGLLGILIDITERKQAEEALRQSEEYFRSLIEKGSDIISVMDKNAIVHYISPSVERILGYKPEELVGTSGFALVHPDDLKRLSVQQDFLAVLGAPGSVSPAVELRDRHKDGTWRTLEVVSRNIVDANGELAIVTNAHDITERKQAEESLRQSMVQLRTTLKAAINSLASAIEMRDPYTAGHQERVTKLASAIAREMGLSEDQIETIQIAGIIHDIGKIYVPAEILSKPGKLNEFEFMIIKTHSEVGYKILSKIEFPWPIADIVHQHHERINGSGYPQRLTGKDILLEAKILGVADVVEAMSSHRPYRPALGIAVALEEISRNKGVIYDAEVADACLKLFAENKFKFE